jgi:hypothetical protein
MKNSLKFLSIFICIFTANTSKANEYKVKKFNYSEMINYSIKPDVVYNDNIKENIYFFSLFNSNDKLVAIKESNETELTPVLFTNDSENEILLKDINNYLNIFSIKTDNNSLKKVTYFEENDSKVSLLKRGGCFGGSTLSCIDHAVSACLNNASCAFACGITWQYCLSGITIACAVNCNKNPQIQAPE